MQQVIGMEKFEELEEQVFLNIHKNKHSASEFKELCVIAKECNLNLTDTRYSRLWVCAMILDMKNMSDDSITLLIERAKPHILHPIRAALKDDRFAISKAGSITTRFCQELEKCFACNDLVGAGKFFFKYRIMLVDAVCLSNRWLEFLNKPFADVFSIPELIKTDKKGMANHEPIFAHDFFIAKRCIDSKLIKTNGRHSSREKQKPEQTQKTTEKQRVHIICSSDFTRDACYDVTRYLKLTNSVSRLIVLSRIKTRADLAPWIDNHPNTHILVYPFDQAEKKLIQSIFSQQKAVEVVRFSGVPSFWLEFEDEQVTLDLLVSETDLMISNRSHEVLDFYENNRARSILTVVQLLAISNFEHEFWTQFKNAVSGEPENSNAGMVLCLFFVNEKPHRSIISRTLIGESMSEDLYTLEFTKTVF